MTSRITDMREFQGLSKPLQGLEGSLRQLVAMRASQINGFNHVSVAFHATPGPFENPVPAREPVSAN
jgi:hypothetical protein